MDDASSTRAFLVDDHPIIREGFRNLLESEEEFVVVGEADSGAEALEKLSRIGADLAVVDISMEGMDGIELTRRLRKSSELGANLKVLIVSMHEETRYVEDALEAGAGGYVLKDNVHILLPQAAHAVIGGELYLDPDLRGSLEL